MNGYWLQNVRRVLIVGTWLLLAVGSLAILDYTTTGETQFLRIFFAYSAGPFYLFAAIVEAAFAFAAAKGFEPQEPLRRPWILLSVSAIFHCFSQLLANILNLTTYINPLYWIAPDFVRQHGEEVRVFGLHYFGDPRFILLGIAFWLVLRAEKKAGLGVKLNYLEIFLLCATGVWVLVHTITAVEWFLTASQGSSLTKQISWLFDFALGAVTMLAIFLRNSVKPLEPGMLAAPWKCYSWAVFITCMGDAGIWAISYSVLPPFLLNLTWLIWFPQVTMFALGPWWQYQAMQTAAGYTPHEANKNTL